MPYFEVWEEGYATNGQEGPTYLAWSGNATSFEEACQSLLTERSKQERGWGPANTMHRFTNGVHHWWGCGWYPSAEEAGSKQWGLG